MADIKDQFVIRRVEHIVDGRCQFDHAKAGPQMPASHGNRINHFGAQFVGKLAQLALFQACANRPDN